VMQPVHSEPGKPAIRILVRAVKGGRAPIRILAGVMLADATGVPDREVEAVLAGQGALAMAGAPP
jgi:tRNA1(Val) A37 N6-methylase TrmN6